METPQGLAIIRRRLLIWWQCMLMVGQSPVICGTDMDWSLELWGGARLRQESYWKWSSVHWSIIWEQHSPYQWPVDLKLILTGPAPGVFSSLSDWGVAKKYQYSAGTFLYWNRYHNMWYSTLQLKEWCPWSCSNQAQQMSPCMAWLLLGGSTKRQTRLSELKTLFWGAWDVIDSDIYFL